MKFFFLVTVTVASPTGIMSVILFFTYQIPGLVINFYFGKPMVTRRMFRSSDVPDFFRHSVSDGFRSLIVTDVATEWQQEQGDDGYG